MKLKLKIKFILIRTILLKLIEILHPGIEYNYLVIGKYIIEDYETNKNFHFRTIKEKEDLNNTINILNKEVDDLKLQVAKLKGNYPPKLN